MHYPRGEKEQLRDARHVFRSVAFQPFVVFDRVVAYSNVADIPALVGAKFLPTELPTSHYAATIILALVERNVKVMPEVSH